MIDLGQWTLKQLALPLLPPLDLRPVILEALGPRRDSSDSASSWSLSALDETASRVHFSSLDFGSPRFVRGGSGTTISVGGGSGSGSRMRLHVTLMQDSMEQEASQLSQDSSNGSVSQPDDEDQSLSLASDTSLRFGRSGGSSGGLDSPTTASTPVAGGGPGIVGGGSSGMLLTTTTPTPTPTPPGPGRGLGTSVIVGGSGSSGRTAGEATPRDGGSGASGSGSPLQGAVSAAHSTSTLAEEEQGIQQATSQGEVLCTVLIRVLLESFSLSVLLLQVILQLPNLMLIILLQRTFFFPVIIYYNNTLITRKINLFQQ